MVMVRMQASETYRLATGAQVLLVPAMSAGIICG